MTAWTEPTRAIPLRWGTYDGRYLAGLTLIVSGGMHLVGSNTYTLNLLLIGTTAHVVGWAIMPARGWRRIIATVPSVAVIWLLLTGPFAVWMLSASLLAWLLVRHRPLASYLVVLLPIANGVISTFFFSEMSQMVPALGIAIAVTVGAAWLARLIAASALIRANRTANRRLT